MTCFVYNINNALVDSLYASIAAIGSITSLCTPSLPPPFTSSPHHDGAVLQLILRSFINTMAESSNSMEPSAGQSINHNMDQSISHNMDQSINPKDDQSAATVIFELLSANQTDLTASCKLLPKIELPLTST